MLLIESIEDIRALRESSDIECKKAGGRDGNGAVPKDLWESYSAFANTYGGDIFLGLSEKADRSFEITGITDTEKVLDDFTTVLNNSEKVSVNILRNSSFKVISIDDKNIIQIHVPRAMRAQKPVYLNGNPLKYTFKRFNSSDVHLDEVQVKRMLAEQTADSRDSTLLKGFAYDDLDHTSINAYRNIYASRQLAHPWNELSNSDFLNKIKAFSKNRETGESGLTAAGLLMFGQFTAIQDHFPNYMLDYQERPEAKTEARWVDRITLDGTWSGNLFDFYRKVIRKLYEDLKVPFILDGDTRKEGSPVHTALREAMVNTLIHADYTERLSILIVKRPDMFGFRNPGLMRIPIEVAAKGGDSDCRNRILQQMFRYVGLGEQAGSGFPKIYEGWSSQHWRKPAIEETSTPAEQTILKMHTLSLVPDNVLEGLISRYGDVFTSLTDDERLIMVTAAIEKTVNHKRMMEIMDIHPRDLSQLFSKLTNQNLLLQEGTGKGTIYFFAETRLLDDLVEFEEFIDEEEKSLETTAAQMETPRAFNETPRANSEEKKSSLEDIAFPVSSRRRTPKEIVENTIIELCKQRALTLEELSQLLGRSVDVVRKDYLQPMVKDKRIRFKYPTNPQHPKQAYEA